MYIYKFPPWQWFKKQTAVAWLAAEVQVQSLAQCSGLKDLRWERPYATGAAIKNKTKQNQKNPTKILKGVPVMAQRLANLTSIHEGMGSIPVLAQ